MIHVTDTIVFDDHEIVERFVRAMGSRGQNPRREAAAVELRLDLDKSSLPSDVKRRLMALAGRHVTTDHVLVLVSRADRSQTKNEETVRARLLVLLEQASAPPASRIRTTVSRAVRCQRAGAKQRHRALKRARRGRSDSE